METYLVNPKKFKGQSVAILRDGKSIFSENKTKADYEKEYNTKLIELSFDELYEQYIEPFNKSLQSPFVEIKEETWYDMLNVLPPMRWTKVGNSEFFFCMEALTADLHSVYVRKGNKYYTALRSKFEKAENIFNLKNVV